MGKAKKTSKGNDNDFDMDTAFLKKEPWVSCGKSYESLVGLLEETYDLEKKRRPELLKHSKQDFENKVILTLQGKIRNLLTVLTKPGYGMVIGVSDPIDYVAFWRKKQLLKYAEFKKNNKIKQAVFHKEKNPKGVVLVRKSEDGKVEVLAVDMRKKTKAGKTNENWGEPLPESSNIATITAIWGSYDEEVPLGVYQFTIGGEMDDELANPNKPGYILDYLREKQWRPAEFALGFSRDDKTNEIKNISWSNQTRLGPLPQKMKEKGEKLLNFEELKKIIKPFNKKQFEVGQHLVKANELEDAWKAIQAITDENVKRNYFVVMRGEAIKTAKNRNDKQGRWTISVQDGTLAFKDAKGRPIRGISCVASEQTYLKQVKYVFGDYSDVIVVGPIDRFKLKDMKTKKETDEWSRPRINVWGIYAPPLYRTKPPETKPVEPEKPVEIEEEPPEVDTEDESFEPDTEETESEDEETATDMEEELGDLLSDEDEAEVEAALEDNDEDEPESEGESDSGGGSEEDDFWE